MHWGLYIRHKLGNVYFDLLSLGRFHFPARKRKSRRWLLKVCCRLAMDKSIIKYKCSFDFSLPFFFFNLLSPLPLSFPLINSANIYWASITCQELCWVLTHKAALVNCDFLCFDSWGSKNSKWKQGKRMLNFTVELWNLTLELAFFPEWSPEYNFVWPNHFFKQSSAILVEASIVKMSFRTAIDRVVINVKLHKPLNISFGGTVTIPYIFPKDHFRTYLTSLLCLWERKLNRTNTVNHASVLLFHTYRS